MGIFTGLIIVAESFVESWGLLGAFLVAVTESFIFPIPTATIVSSMTTFGMDPLLVTVIATIGSVIGGIIGFFLGKRLGHPVAVRLFKEKRVNKVEKWFQKWGAWAVFLAAFTPIPFKVFTWCAGIFDMSFKKFLIASIAGRFIQFTIAAYVGSLFGPAVLAFFGGI